MKLKPIKELFNIEKGSLQSTKAVPGKYHFITASIDWKTNNSYTHNCEAILVAVAASGSLGRVHYVNDKFIGSDLCFIMTSKNPKEFPVNLKLYKFILNLVRDDLVYKCATGSAKKAINITNFGNYELPYLDKSVQDDIIPLLSLIEESVFNINVKLESQKYDALKLRETILQLAVQGKLTESWRANNPNTEPASELLKRIEAEKKQLMAESKIKKEKPLPPIGEDEIPYELPEGWVWEYLGKSMLKITDGTHHSPPNIEHGNYKYVTAKNIKDNGIKLSNITYVSEEVHKEIYARCNPEIGDLLYIKDGATTGICCINNLEEQFSMLSSVALIKQPKEIIGDYLLSVFRSPYYYDLMRAGMTGVAITRVTLTKLKASVIPVPPLEEQKIIVEKVSSLMALFDELEQQIESSQTQIEQLMQSCLQEVFEH